MTWKEDRLTLRTLLSQKQSGLKATMLCVLVAHMRGKVHMRWFAKWSGGWRTTWRAPARDAVQDKHFATAYNAMAQYYFEKAVIENLQDQEEWIRQYFDHRWLDDIVVDIAKRVVDKSWSLPRISTEVVAGAPMV